MGWIRHIRLQNFRSYDEADFDFQPGLILIEGPNGIGKTSILEAIAFSSLLRSFRTKNTQHLRQRDKEDFHILTSVCTDDDSEIKLRVHYGDKRKLFLNGQALHRSSDFIRNINTISFSPEDIRIIKGSSKDRRQFLDIFLAQLHPAYIGLLQAYNQALQARNSLLKSKTQDINYLRSFDKTLAENGLHIHNMRQRTLEELKAHISKIAIDMGGPDFTLKTTLNSSIFRDTTTPPTIELYLQTLENNRERDLFRGSTQAGPHRDELLIELNNQVMQSFASEGQSRLASLILKMATAEMLIENDGLENVILLIDDVLGELDQKRRESFLECACRGDQTFIACTEIPKACLDKEFQLIKLEEKHPSPNNIS